uniref:BEN domain-containing protein n=2 Tax=Magallana gigas TaxID=29159 RepID=A0A8W8JT97_MAGGI
MSKLLLALVEWQEEGFPLGVINLRAIEDPRLPFEDYRVGLDVYAKCQGFPGSHPAKILKIGDDRRELHNEMDLLRTTPIANCPCSTEEETRIPQEKPAGINKKQKGERATEQKPEQYVDPTEKKKAQDEQRKKKFEEKKNEAVLKKKARTELNNKVLQELNIDFNRIQNEDIESGEDLLPLQDMELEFTQLSDDSDHEEINADSELIALTDLPVQEVNAKGHNTVAQKAPRSQHISLEEKYAEAIKENGILKCKDYSMPKPGKLSSDVAKRYKMVELTPGSGVYLYQHDIDYVQRVRDPSAQGTAAYGKRIAKLLMNIFFTKKDFPDCKLSPNAKGHLVLDETVTSAIINFSAQKSCATKGAIRQAMASKLSSARTKSKKIVQHS